MAYDHLLVEREDRVISVTFNRPERMNAFDEQTVSEFVDVLSEYRDTPDLWAMILTGAGERSFCSGLDVKSLAASQADSLEKVTLYDSWKPFVDVMQAINKPFIAAVNGLCVGGAWHLIADSDIVIAADNAQFMDTHVNIGLINGVESIGLAWKMPLGVVMRMVIEGRHWRVSAQQAYQWGLVTEVVPLPDLMPKAREIARHIVEESAPLAVQGSKKAILGGLSRGLHDGIAYGWTVLPEVRDTADIVEGPRAFSEKRKPQFVGR
jgi:enoyl-CoA hydratase/carnithine racemase